MASLLLKKLWRQKNFICGFRRRKRLFYFKVILISLIFFVFYIIFYQIYNKNLIKSNAIGLAESLYSDYGAKEIFLNNNKWNGAGQGFEADESVKSYGAVKDYEASKVNKHNRDDSAKRLEDVKLTEHSGPGEWGRGVEARNKTEQVLMNASIKKWFMNMVASDQISLDRSLPDQRSAECRKLKYNLYKLPKASIIIIFTEEGWSTLLRTVHSILNRTPKELLEEIVLVDDFSQRGLFYFIINRLNLTLQNSMYNLILLLLLHKFVGFNLSSQS